MPTFKFAIFYKVGNNVKSTDSIKIWKIYDKAMTDITRDAKGKDPEGRDVSYHLLHFFFVRSERLRDGLILTVFFISTYCSIRSRSGLEQIFNRLGRIWVDLGPPSPLHDESVWIWDNYIFLYVFFPLTAPFRMNQGGSSANPDPFAPLLVS